MNTNQEKIFIVAGPSGVGKDTIIEAVMEKIPSLVRVKSHTSRPPRLSDEGDNRIFISTELFEQMIEKNEMIEWQKVHGNYYGIAKSSIESYLEKNKNMILDIDVKGTQDFKKMFANNLVSIFLKYEKPEYLKSRILLNRPETSAEELQTRYNTMLSELTYEKYFDYVVINYEGYPEKAIDKTLEIIKENIS